MMCDEGMKQCFMHLSTEMTALLKDEDSLGPKKPHPDLLKVMQENVAHCLLLVLGT